MNKTLIITIVLALISFSSVAQDSKKLKPKDSAIIKMLERKNFTFLAESANPMTGSTRPLTTYYDVRISGDSVISALPYFGRAYSIPVPGSSGGINFTSLNFEYKLSQRKKGGWELIIVFKDQDDVRQFTFTIFKNGSAILNVRNNNRQPISFYGRINVP